MKKSSIFLPMMIKLCYIDTETTGTNHYKNALVQLAGAIYILQDNKYERKEDFNFKIKPFPEDIIEDEALAINKITREDLKHFYDPKVIHQDLTEIFEKYCDKFNKEDKMFFVGYNSRFDYDFVRKFWEKCGDKYFGSWFFFPPIDVMNTAIVHLIEKRHTLPNFKLGTVADYLGIEVHGEFHDAMADIETTRMIFEKFVKLDGR
jgi:DNA polymerase-3 subunit epsilon